MYRYLLSRSRACGLWLGACALVALSGNSWALGLGEIELDSALNEEFVGTIELFDAEGLGPTEIVVSLATAEDFERVGVERFFFLTDLSFEVTYGADGSAVVVVRSSRPVTEPYLNFLVEVLWPNGRLLKEFTVLLDPPTFSAAAAPRVAAPVESRQAAPTAGRVQRQPAQTSGTRVQVAPTPSRAPAPSPLDQEVVGGEYRMTDRTDTLWSIGSRTLASDQITVQQNMLAIARLNPEAFIDGNINLMKAGFNLRLPDETEARGLSRSEAIQAVAQHNAAWKAFTRGEAVAASPSGAPQAAAPQVANTSQAPSNMRSPVDATTAPVAERAAPRTDGELRIVAGDGDSAAGIANTDAAKDVAAVLEENDRLSREVDELTYQVDRDKELANNQITIKDRQLEVKDQQIAELQAQLAQAQAEAAAAPAATPAAVEAPAQQNQNQNMTQAPWWQSPLVLYGGAGVLVLALVGGMLAARRRRETDDEIYAEDTADADFGDASFADEAVLELDEEDDAGEDDTVLATVGAGADEEADSEIPGSETGDVIGEADIYIAYGRYPQAIGLLLGVLEDDPARNDVRLKLLELFSETNDREAFDEHMALLVEHCDVEEPLLAARELESQFGEQSISLDEVLAEEQSLDDTHIEEVAEEGLDLDFDTAETGLAGAGDLPALDMAAEDQDAASLDAEFELELDEIDDDNKLVVAQGSPGDDLGGDLGIDFDPDRDVDTSTLEPVDTSTLEPVEEDSTAKSIEYTSEHAEATDAGEAPEAGAAGFEFTPTSELDDDHIDLDDLGVSLDLDSGSDEIAMPGGASNELEAELDGDLALADEDEFDFQDEGDSANTKLDLARAYIDMGDAEGARDILKEVVDEGNSEQQQQAQAMLEAL